MFDLLYFVGFGILVCFTLGVLGGLFGGFGFGLFWLFALVLCFVVLLVRVLDLLVVCCFDIRLA